jgi:alpha-1,2-mannosyltransferase
VTEAGASRIRSVLVRTATFAVCLLLPAVSLYYVWEDVLSGPGITPDFGLAYYPAGEAVLDGEPVYPEGELELRSGFIVEYVYPPLTAIAVTPLTALPVDVASALFSLFLVAVLVATLLVLGVRDWRCFGLAFLWPPVQETIDTGNVTVVLGLAAALVWRFRDRPRGAGVSLGVGLATKLLLSPLLLWLLITRRLRALAWTIVVAAVVLLASWSVIRFEQVGDYPDLLSRLSDIQDGRGYTLYALGLDVGLPDLLARALWIALGAGVLLAMAIVARRGDERRAFVLAVAAVLACTPIVWLHYLTLLLVVVAIAEPRLGPAWFVGLAMQLVVSTGVYNGSTFQTAAVLALMAVTVALALRPAWPMRSAPLTKATPAAQSQ